MLLLSSLILHKWVRFYSGFYVELPRNKCLCLYVYYSLFFSAITAGFRMQTDLVSPFNGSGLYADGGESVRSGADADDAVDIPAPTYQLQNALRSRGVPCRCRTPKSQTLKKLAKLRTLRVIRAFKGTAGQRFAVASQPFWSWYYVHCRGH